MGSVPYALGRQLQFFCKKETVMGGNFGLAAQEYFVADDAAKVTASDMNFAVERLDRMDSSTTRSTVERVTGKQEVTWSCESYILPAGGSTAPDIDPLLEGAFGGGFGATTAKTYQLTDGTDEIPSIHLARGAAGVFREDVFGAWVEEFSLSVSGGDIPKMSFSGGAMNYALTGTSKADGTGSSSTALTVDSGDGVNFMIGSPLNVNSTDRVVTSGNTDALTLGVAADWSDEDVIVPVFPATGTSNFNGPPTAATAGSITIDGTTYPVMSFDVTLANGIKALGDQAFVAGANDYIPMVRSVTGNVTIRLRKDHLKAFSRRNKFVSGLKTYPATPIVVTLGDATGYKQVISIPYAELDFGNVTIPEVEEAVLNLPFKGLGSSGKDELTFAWNQA